MTSGFELVAGMAHRGPMMPVMTTHKDIGLPQRAGDGEEARLHSGAVKSECREMAHAGAIMLP